MGQVSRPEAFGVSLELLRAPSLGRAYDLSSGWWHRMPMWDGHAQLQVMTYRTPQGEVNQRDLDLMEENDVQYGFISDLVMGSTHAGTHIDALAHVTVGPDQLWHGGHSARTDLGDFGPLNGDAAELKPLITRGVLLDLPAAQGIEHLPASTPAHARELEAARAAQGTEIHPGSVILVRTGMMRFWPDVEAMGRAEHAGVSLDGAEWLIERSPLAVGADTESVEVWPSGIPGDPEPVHRRMIQEEGIPLIEFAYLEELARDRVYEFLFICIPLSIRGATGSLVRPLAIV
jgi:kynurenine formamidase